MSQRSRRAPSRRPRKPAVKTARPSCEGLEARDLPSFFSMLLPTSRSVVPTPRPSSLPPNTSGRVVALYDMSLTSHPLYQSVTDGHVTKAPMFSATYRGPRTLSLGVIGASARFSPQQGFSLNGQVLGPISTSEPAEYTFLLDRGGAPARGPLAIRPRIVYDAEVTVTTGPGGQAGAVSLLDAQGKATSTVDLPAEAVRVRGATVSVSVPTGLLPSTGTPRAQQKGSGYRFTFTAGLPGSDPAAIAGFAPEYVPATVAIAGGRGR